MLDIPYIFERPNMNQMTPPPSYTLSRHGKPVTRKTGNWELVRECFPTFRLEDFAAAGEERANPYLKAVVRQAADETDRPVPVAVVSPNYGLMQHAFVGDRVVKAMQVMGVHYDRMQCDLEMTELGEWMHVRFVLDEIYSVVPPDGAPVRFCIDLYNSVDGQSRLALQTSWLRLVCKNGLIARVASNIGLIDVHDRHVHLGPVEEVLAEALGRAAEDAIILEDWWSTKLQSRLEHWVDTTLADKWGKNDAARVLNICNSGFDGNPQKFTSDPPSQLKVQNTRFVPGSNAPATTLYDVAQALSWVAGSRSNLAKRDDHLADIPELLEILRK